MLQAGAHAPPRDGLPGDRACGTASTCSRVSETLAARGRRGESCQGPLALGLASFPLASPLEPPPPPPAPPSSLVWLASVDLAPPAPCLNRSTGLPRRQRQRLSPRPPPSPLPPLASLFLLQSPAPRSSRSSRQGAGRSLPRLKRHTPTSFTERQARSEGGASRRSAFSSGVPPPPRAAVAAVHALPTRRLGARVAMAMANARTRRAKRARKARI